MSADSPNRIGSPKLSPSAVSPGGTAGSGGEFPFHMTTNNENIGQSPPPHSYRHSRAYRHFKNPPQPHMCIRVATVQGEELFINVLSWTRIVMPQDPTDPIPLYGGMKVPPGSPRCPPLVYAVMANPEVLKYSGRHCKDPEERRAMIELMCDFVEAMNPDLRLTRNAVILKDRDISGELKDVWNAVQAQRDREREEQIPHQQQQQQCAAPPPQQMFMPHDQQTIQQQQLQMQQIELQSQNMQQMHKIPTLQDENNFSIERGLENIRNGTASNQQIIQEATNNVEQKTNETRDSLASIAQSAINFGNYNINSVNDKQKCIEAKSSDVNSDITDSKLIIDSDNDMNVSPTSANNDNIQINSENNQITSSPVASKQISTANTVSISNTVISSSNAAQNVTIISTAASTSTSQNVTTTVTTTTPTPTPVLTTKKEKLGGFLPNGCHNIFPRFKNNKHKDKDKEKEKDKDKEITKSASGKDKEKTLLNSFKRSSNSSTNTGNKSQQHQNDDTKTTQYEKNCINLEAEVEKLDLNKLDTPSNDVLIKLKVASSGAK